MRRVLTHQRSVGSLGLDSITSSGAPPPGYTSQRDTASFVSMNNDEEEEILNNPSPPPPSMDSPYRDPLCTLLSPYSIEDIRRLTIQPAVESHVQNQNPSLSLQLHCSPTQGCTHGYTHTHSQCTPVSPFEPTSHSTPNVQLNCFPTTSDMPSVRSNSYYPPQQHQPDDLFSSNEQSRPSSGPYHQCSTEYCQPAVHQQTTPQYIDYNLSSSPYLHHHQNTNPPPLRILTYPSADEGEYDHCEERGNEEEDEDGDGDGNGNGNQSPPNNTNMIMMMDSTATILSPPEELACQSRDPALPPRPRRLRRPSPLNEALGPATSTTCDVVGLNATKTATKKLNPKNPAGDNSTLPTQTQPTNYVHLSRKCSPSIPISKSWGWRRKSVQPSTQIPPSRLPSSSSSAITGAITINPELYIPPSLLNAMEDPVFRFSPSPDSRMRDKRGGSRRTNLKLEVENGGIDVDIRLVPTSISSTSGGEKACIGNRGQLDTFCDTPVQAQASASTSTTAFSHATEAFENRPQPSSTHPRLSTISSTRMQENPAQPSGTTRKEATVLKPAVRQTLSKRDKKKPTPTTIDLRIKQALQGNLNVQDEDSVKINGPPLIARIHAPNPRPPFHLFASTIDIIAKSLPQEPQCLNTHGNQSRASTSNPTSVQIFSEPILAMNPLPLPPPPPSRRRTRRSLSKSRPKRRGVSSSYGGTPVGPAHAPSSLPTTITTTTSQLGSVPLSSSSSSPLYLHLPRTFRGPLTIHISSGHISDHLRLSEGLEREVALIRESEFGRGYFVGGLGWDADDANLDRERDGNNANFDEKRARGGNNRQLVNIERTQPIINHEDSELSSSSISSSSSTSTTLPGKKLEEWYGDRIEILVGCGDVYLQFEDEEDDDGDLFRSGRSRKEVGFWKRVTKVFF